MITILTAQNTSAVDLDEAIRWILRDYPNAYFAERDGRVIVWPSETESTDDKKLIMVLEDEDGNNMSGCLSRPLTTDIYRQNPPVFNHEKMSLDPRDKKA